MHPHHHPPTPQPRPQRRQQQQATRTKLPQGIIMLSPKDMTSHRPVLKDRSNSNSNGGMTPTAAEDSSIESSLYSANHHKELRDSYGVPHESPTPSGFWNFPDSPSEAESPSPSPYYYQRPMAPNSKMTSPTDTDMYLDDEQSNASSNLSSLEEHSDMFTFATAAASILQQAREEEEGSSSGASLVASPEGKSTSTTFSTPSVPYRGNNEDTPIMSNNKNASLGNKDTPLVKNTGTSKKSKTVAPYRRDIGLDDHRETIIDWGKFTHPKANPSPLSLPTMLGEPASSNNSVSELESPVLFLASSMGEVEAAESDTIQSEMASQATDIHSPKSVEFSLDLCQADPSAAMRAVAMSTGYRDSKFVASDNVAENIHSGGQATANPSKGAAATYTASNSKVHVSDGDIEIPSNARHEQQTQQDDDTNKEKPSKTSCCNLPLRWKFLGLFLIACAVFVPIIIGKWRDRAASPTDLSGEGQVVAEVPTVAPIQTITSQPTKQPGAVVVKPTSVPTLRPTLPTVEATAGPTPTPSIATPTTSQPTARQPVVTMNPTRASMLRPTSTGNAPIGRPSAYAPTAPEPAPTISPIWSSVMTGENQLEEASLAEIHWPQYDSKNGLRLEILNALEDQWQSALITSVENWNAFGAMDLTVVNVPSEEEEECEPVWGKVKICNQNYGETNWRGMIQVFLRSGNVVATSLRLNDFYSLERGWAQYTLCHQLGHAFGLGDGVDLNCMKSVNLYHDEISIQLQNPDDSIGVLLREAYGEVGERRRLQGRFQHATKQATSGYEQVLKYYI
jgi:hypothetical protein